MKKLRNQTRECLEIGLRWLCRIWILITISRFLRIFAEYADVFASSIFKRGIFADARLSIPPDALMKLRGDRSAKQAWPCSLPSPLDEKAIPIADEIDHAGVGTYQQHLVESPRTSGIAQE